MILTLWHKVHTHTSSEDIILLNVWLTFSLLLTYKQKYTVSIDEYETTVS